MFPVCGIDWFGGGVGEKGDLARGWGSEVDESQQLKEAIVLAGFGLLSWKKNASSPE